MSLLHARLYPDLPPLHFPSVPSPLLSHPFSFLPSFSQSLYDNEQQIQDQLARFWATVADHFSDNRYVLGYELLNEPWAGDIYRHPNQLEPCELAVIRDA